MKSNILLAASLFAVCATGSVMSMMSMEPRRLDFTLNRNTEITGYSEQHMAFLNLSHDFLGKSVTDVLSLNAKDNKAFIAGCCMAMERRKTVRVLLEKRNLRATITPLSTTGTSAYLVKIVENYK
ncbi:MAG TPA: hypothetical protein VHX42_05205 [Candidatus Babeliales bacterium]|jgi:hypothetical protein|nr:hypothetical protein [Candidatus Babeliales bacterium]